MAIRRKKFRCDGQLELGLFEVDTAPAKTVTRKRHRTPSTRPRSGAPEGGTTSSAQTAKPRSAPSLSRTSTGQPTRSTLSVEASELAAHQRSWDDMMQRQYEQHRMSALDRDTNHEHEHRR